MAGIAPGKLLGIMHKGWSRRQIAVIRGVLVAAGAISGETCQDPAVQVIRSPGAPGDRRPLYALPPPEPRAPAAELSPARRNLLASRRIRKCRHAARATTQSSRTANSEGLERLTKASYDPDDQCGRPVTGGWWHLVRAAFATDSIPSLQLFYNQ